jgi:signal transduction histidine kinase
MNDDHITLTVDVPGSLPRVRCATRSIQEVVMGLLANARDALNERYPGPDPDKKVIISARVVARGAGGHAKTEAGGQARGTGATVAMDEVMPRRVRLTVEDRGVGIPAGLHERIFDPFFTTKNRATRAGLGLSVSHGIIIDHGGELTVESVAGGWTRFHMDLPVASEQDVSVLELDVQ